MTYCVFDLETTIRQSFKRKANPFDSLNFVVMSGYKHKGSEVFGDYFGRDKKPFNWFTKLLAGTKILVGQNIKFDLLYALQEQQNLEAWMDWVADGGNVWDVQLAEYLLNGMQQEDHMLSMDELAPRYGGNLKFDEVKALWQAGVCTADIDEDLLRRYLCGTKAEHGDIGNTEVIFLGQLERARQAKQVKSIMLNMGSLLCTVEMERNGMRVDEALGLQHAVELDAELKQLKAGLAAFLPADLPPEIDFNWTNRYHLSPLIFGGSIKYERSVHQKDPDSGELLYAQKKEDHYLLADGTTMSKEAYLRCIQSDAPEGAPTLQYFAGGLRKGEPKTKQVTVPDHTKPKTKLTEFRYHFPRMTEPKKSWASSTEGLYSVASEVIDELGNRDIPFLKALSKVATLSKDLGTYYIVTDEKGNTKGMLSLVQDGIIHHSINHTSTVTGRFSSSNPNLQNVSKGSIDKDGNVKGSRIKLVFISRFPDGIICQSDFTALEVYCQAILTRCRQLILDLRDGLDMHCSRVATKEKISYEEALLRCKGNDTTPAIPEWDKKRTDAKVFSFQRAYGAGAAKISESTGIPRDEVDALIIAEDERYPEISQYYIRLGETIKANRKPTSRFCQHPDNPTVTCQLGRSFARTPDNKLYAYQESPAPEFLLKKGITVGFSPTEIKNYVVQGTGGEWAKAAMWLAIRAFYKRKNFQHRALLVNQVHDALYGDFAREVHQEASALLHACMEGASEFIEWYFGWNVPVPVPSVTECGPNMMQADEMKSPEWRSRAAQYRAELRKLYMQDYNPTFEQE